MYSRRLEKILGIIRKGIRIVQLIPQEIIYDDKSGGMALMMMIMELTRGNSESKVKSERVGHAWSQKRIKAREELKVMTVNLPAWVRKVTSCQERNGKLELIPEKAAIVQRIFQDGS